MTRHPAYIPPELNEQWLAMQLKQQKQIHEFQETAKKNRAVFESRVETARQDLLAKHLSEHRDFWDKHGQVEDAAEQKKVSNHKTTTATPLRNVTSPLSQSSTAHSGASKGKQSDKCSATPNRTVQRVQVLPAHKKRLHAPSKLKPALEVIDLCDSEDEGTKHSAPKGPPARAPVVPKAATRDSAHQVVNQGHARYTDECLSIDQSPAQLVQVQHETVYSIPEATLELFGGVPKKQTVSLHVSFLDTYLWSV